MQNDTDTRISLSRRSVLGAVGTIGAASVGAGVGTSAFLTDEESFENNVVQAGELDLLVDFEEHYSGAADPADYGYVRPVAPDATLASEEVGIPSQENPLVAVDTSTSAVDDPVKAYMDATAIDSFPDTDGRTVTVDGTDYTGTGTADDGVQDAIPVNDGERENSAECEYLQPLVPDSGDVLSADARTNGTIGDVNPQTTSSGDPLVSISDVKPGDFGEVTFSVHPCGNPAYVGLGGKLVDNDENGFEPAEPEDLTETVGELLDNTMAAVWYDAGSNNVFEDAGSEPTSDPTEGDNILQVDEEVVGEESTNRMLRAPLGTVLDLLEQGIPLDGDRSSSFNEVAAAGADTAISSKSGFDTVFLSDEDSDDGDRVDDSSPDCDGLGYAEAEKIETEGDEFERIFDELTDDDSTTSGSDSSLLDEGTSVVLTTDAGRITIEDMTPSDDSTEYVDITISTDFPVRAVIAKGGSNGRIWEDSDGGVLDSVTFSAPDNASRSSAALSYLSVCYEPDAGDPDDPDREPFANSTTAYIGFAWYVPPDVGNEIQGDSLAFNVGFAAEQARNNDDPSV